MKENSDKIKLAILISGRGSNMKALLKACQDPSYPAEISVVISNRPDAIGLETARNAGVKTEIVDHKMFQDRAAFDEALYQRLRQYPVDLICLAGFMRILGADFINRWPENRIVNIHPSLLPAYKGLDPQTQALEDKATKSGCSVHYVTAELDSGPVILQRDVPVLKDDNRAALSARILAEEHIAYPDAVRIVAEDILTKRRG